MDINVRESYMLNNKIVIAQLEEVVFVKKPWGWEKWIADGTPKFPYALKQIFMRAPNRSSLQFHAKKQETIYIEQGKGFLYYSRDPIDIDCYISEKYDKEELEYFIKNLTCKEIGPGCVFHVPPGFVHRVEAIEDLLMIESSTTELDDIFRLADDSERTHGRIIDEHKF